MIESVSIEKNEDSFIDSLIDRYRPESETFDVKLPGGEVFKFRACADLAEIQKLREGAQEFLKWVGRRKLPKEWEPIVTDDPEVLVVVYCVAELSVEPKLTQFDVLRLARACAPVVELMSKSIDLSQSRVLSSLIVSDVEEKKSEYGGTPSGETN